MAVKIKLEELENLHQHLIAQDLHKKLPIALFAINSELLL